MMVNPDADGYAKTVNHRQILRKTKKQQQPMENQKTAKSEK